VPELERWLRWFRLGETRVNLPYKLLLVACGGGVGSMLRFLVHEAARRWFDVGFPVGTLAVNVVGCLCIGSLGAVMVGPGGLREDWRLLLMVGLLGGFTTFSAFGLDTIELWRAGHVGRAAGYVIATNVLCLAATALGFAMTARFFPSPVR